MSNMGDLKAKLAGTSALDSGGESTVNDLSDIIVTLQKAADDSLAADVLNRTFWRNKLGCALRVISAEYIPDGAVTAHDTNYATLALQVGTPGALVVAASQTTKITGGSGNFVADTAVPLTVSTTEANIAVPAGTILNFDIAKAAGGVVITSGALVVKLRRV